MAYGQYGGYPAAGYGTAGLAPSSYPIQPSMPMQRPVPTVPLAFTAQQSAHQGWVGPYNGQYQLVSQHQGVPSEAVPVPQAIDNQSYAVPSVAQPAPSVQPVPMQSYPAQSYPAQGYVQQPTAGCSSCGQAGSAMYGATLAPTASGYGSDCGTCGFGGAYAPVNGTPGCFSGTFAPAVNGNRNWFVGAGALLFNRVDDDRIALTYDTGMPSVDVLTTRSARLGLHGGFEIFGGRYFNCGRNAIVGSYWGLFPSDAMATATTSTNLRSRHPFGDLTMPGGPTVYDWYDGAIVHRVRRSAEYHNVEVNLLGFGVGGAARSFGCGVAPRSGYLANMFSGGGSCATGVCGTGYCGDPCGAPSCGPCGSSCNPCIGTTGPCGFIAPGCGSRLNLTWLAGFRYFRFEDNFEYAASSADGAFTGGADDIYYNINTTNDLAGFQLGGIGNVCVGKRVNLWGSSKFGVYNNRSTLFTSIQTNEMPPDYATITAPAFLNSNYMVDAYKNDVALLGEIGCGLGVCMSRGFSATVGYRVLGASGIATAVSQIPFNMSHLGNVADYNNNSSLILHGLQIGGVYNF